MSREYCNHIIDLLSPWGEVSAKAMFGGFGVYCCGKIFGIVFDDTFYMKVGDSNRKDYEAADSEAFTYESGKGKRVALSYWQVPADVLEDADMLCAWAEKACKVGN